MGGAVLPIRLGWVGLRWWREVDFEPLAVFFDTPVEYQSFLGDHLCQSDAVAAGTIAVAMVDVNHQVEIRLGRYDRNRLVYIAEVRFAQCLGNRP